jgi:hypothetical protein
MSAVMLAAQKAGAVGTLAPEGIVRAAVPPLDGAPDPAVNAASTAAHFGYGIGHGVVFDLLAPYLPGPRRLRGPLFAVALMAGSYGGWLPAARLFTPLHRQEPGRRATLLAGHLVYGAVLGSIAQGHIRCSQGS